jgi:hypothetical protein
VVDDEMKQRGVFDRWHIETLTRHGRADDREDA